MCREACHRSLNGNGAMPDSRRNPPPPPGWALLWLSLSFRNEESKKKGGSFSQYHLTHTVKEPRAAW